jgi:hypothetical protein
MHPALRSWRDELPARLVRFLAYLGAIALLSIAASHLFQSPKVMSAITPVHKPEWIDVERPFAAFALSIPEAADVPASYAIRRHAEGSDRKDILVLGEPDSASPYLQVEIYRAGSETSAFADPETEIVTNARALGPIEVTRLEKTLASRLSEEKLRYLIVTAGMPPQPRPLGGAFYEKYPGIGL